VRSELIAADVTGAAARTVTSLDSCIETPGARAAATVGFVALALWPAASGVPGPRTACAVTIGLIAVLGWLLVELHDGDLLGLSERVLAGAEALWPLAVTLAVRRRARRVRRG
jgi:hypothetical protein